MKLITRDTDYSVRALCFIAKQDKKVVSVTELTKELKIPRPFLRKILQILNKEGFLKSLKGQGGGFALALGPNKIFIVDLIKSFQGPLKLNQCIFKKKLCPERKKCLLKKKLDSIENYVISELKSVSIKSLLN